MKNRLLFVCLVLVCNENTNAQNPFTSPVFQFREEKNIIYGTATDFAGNQVSLEMDVFKPIGDGNLKRPIYLHFHGGSWVEISNKEQTEGREVCKDMARRGYLAANVEYRRGFHRLNYYEPYALCSSVVFAGLNNCLYPFDTSEIFRAVFRGMQDAKGAIRFLKSHHLQDSSDIENVFIGGESAGGFIAFATAFMDCLTEKPLSCYTLSNALPADSDFSGCHVAPINLTRADLGSIEGNLNFDSGYNAEVKGVANFFGGVFHNLLENESGKIPAAFLFHQTSDAVVDCYCKSPYATVFEQIINPLNLCQPLITAPVSCGTCSIRDYLNSNPPNKPIFHTEIIENGQANAFANPTGHAYDNILLRTDQMANFFSNVISGQVISNDGKGCETVSDLETNYFSQMQAIAFPNPFNEAFSFHFFSENSEEMFYRLIDTNGREIIHGKEYTISGKNIFFVKLDSPPGVYFLEISIDNFRTTLKLVKFI